VAYLAIRRRRNLAWPSTRRTTGCGASENAQAADARTGAILNSIDHNLRPFKSHGGVLIQYVGWGDTEDYKGWKLLAINGRQATME
jgi:hypothetical protein